MIPSGDSIMWWVENKNKNGNSIQLIDKNELKEIQK